MLYKEWIDFVIYPLDSNRVLTREQRLDTSNAIRVTDSNYTPTLGTEKGAIYTKDLIIFDWDDDEFEALWIGVTGNIIVWTRKRVWALYKLEAMERFSWMPRHPDSEDLKLITDKLKHYGE